MLTELATLLRSRPLKLRCARVGGSWIFSRYDAIVLMLEPEQQNQARKIWDRLSETHPEFDALQELRCFKFGGAGQQQTPMAGARDIDTMFLLVPGLQAAAKRRSVASPPSPAASARTSTRSRGQPRSSSYRSRSFGNPTTPSGALFDAPEHRLPVLSRTRTTIPASFCTGARAEARTRACCTWRRYSTHRRV